MSVNRVTPNLTPRLYGIPMDAIERCGPAFRLISRNYAVTRDAVGRPWRGMEWARQDSNLRPRDYESPALTAVLQALVTGNCNKAPPSAAPCFGGPPPQ